MWGIQKVAVIKLNSFMMLLCPKSASEFSFGFEHFLIINFFCTILLLPFNVVILGILLHFWGEGPLWHLWPSISEGENELLWSKIRNTPWFSYWFTPVNIIQGFVRQKMCWKSKSLRLFWPFLTFPQIFNKLQKCSQFHN